MNYAYAYKQAEVPHDIDTVRRHARQQVSVVGLSRRAIAWPPPPATDAAGRSISAHRFPSRPGQGDPDKQENQAIQFHYLKVKEWAVASQHIVLNKY
ncbi:hypothetical protein P5P81_05810 [Tritonibacter mobilis]|nr:hypothetical protein [Tritonibacter mobilis]